MQDDIIIQKATFNPKVSNYWSVATSLIFLSSIGGIVFIPFWLLFGLWYTKRLLASMSCTLTNKTLLVRKGIFIRIEKTIPLDKITDLGLVQGPIMRHYGIEKLTVETAGQSGVGALVDLTSIIDAKAFRENVLKQRDLLCTNNKAAPQILPTQSGTATDKLLGDIKTVLEAIEKKLPDSNHKN